MTRPIVDIRKDLSRTLESITMNIDPIKDICAISYSSYMIVVNTLMTASIPVARFTTEIRNGLDYVNIDVLKDLDRSINKLINNMPQIILPKYMDPKSASITSLFNDTCLNFKDTIPADLLINISSAVDISISRAAEGVNMDPADPSIFVNTGKDVVDMMMEANAEISNLLKLPTGLTAGILTQINRAKDAAIDEVFGDLSDIISKPIRYYEGFLASTGVSELIKKLETYEKCLTKKGLCNKKMKDIQEKTTKKVYSRYFRDVFLIDSNGKVKMNKLSDSKQKIKSITNINKKIDLFKYQ